MAWYWPKECKTAGKEVKWGFQTITTVRQGNSYSSNL